MMSDRHEGQVNALRETFLEHLRLTQGKHPISATAHDRYLALARTVRDAIVDRWIATHLRFKEEDPKRIYYLSAEFLLGRTLRNNLQSAGMLELAREVLAADGVDLGALEEEEPDAGLGNGGLGRLAACFLDSLATLGYAAYGYGIRYEFGIFEQRFENGWQVERPDEWLRFGNPWEIVRPEYTTPVGFGGHTEEWVDHEGRWRVRWVPAVTVLGVPYDTPIAGHGLKHVNTLRLWSARASEEFDLDVFNRGDYVRAVEEKTASEVISKVLYPSDNTWAGRELRLKQQYFFVACAIADIVRRYRKTHTSFAQFADKVAMQLNDTHPAVAVAELMRVLVDLHALGWDEAWEITVKTFGYTNHTLLAEALERWPVALFERLLPRHLQIIYEINARFLRTVMNRWPNDPARTARMSLIEEGGERMVRMAHLAAVGAHKINGVAALHSALLQKTVLGDFAELWPERFNNKTNGVTPRRWLLSCNPGLASLLTEVVGAGWETELDRLRGFARAADDPAVRARFREIKRDNKRSLARWLAEEHAFEVDPDALFDVQIKRIHEYKRQLLNALHIVGLYLRAKRDRHAPRVPRVFLFGGKAAPAYRVAKVIIRFINAVSEVLRQDPDAAHLKVLYLPNYGVSLAERVIPAADLSEQISTAGKEASGTGNMKFALNGALTIGTLDGANIEIRDAVGSENFFLFGLETDEVNQRLAEGYNPRDVLARDAELREVLDLIRSGHFSVGEPGLFRPMVDGLLDHDPYMVLADYSAYSACQREVEAAWVRPDHWDAMAIRNVANMGHFSSDRTIAEYARDVWGAAPLGAPEDRSQV
ncbi:MAG: glycogen/starch/alpha-glucan phosphorylase [Myxococcales bacterium]|nr:glycogen/starch/alpha-glucan phosphorylase [Myxococcales bacterium]